MKALSLTQPYATLIALGYKIVETRSWRTHYRGPLAIHAAAGFPAWARQALITLPICREIFFPQLAGSDAAPSRADEYRVVAALTRGAVLLTAELIDVVPVEQVRGLSYVEHQVGDYTPGRFAWQLRDIRVLTCPIPARGALGLWDWQRVRVDPVAA